MTTLIAILPLAFGMGEGVIMASEMAVVVVGGLFSSTLLTLLVVPVIYSLAYSRRQ
ncbi:MAG: efflux RND transporter permease subunit [Dehalococcoidales bacterium]|nr:efflux RND transporter permease subunit [Dehalococcoidales bacterium]